MKIIETLAIAVILALFTAAARLGRRLAGNPEDRALLLNRHRFIARTTLAAMSVNVVFIDAVARIRHLRPAGPLFAVHLSFSIPCLIFLIMLNSVMDGNKGGRRHRILAYVTIASYFGTAITGFWLTMAVF